LLPWGLLLDPHREHHAEATVGLQAEPECQIDLVHLCERARHPAVPFMAALLGAQSSVRLVHGPQSYPALMVSSNLGGTSQVHGRAGR
jgi:hypothetical protein